MEILGHGGGNKWGRGVRVRKRGGAENPAAEWGRGWDTLESAWTAKRSTASTN